MSACNPADFVHDWCDPCADYTPGDYVCDEKDCGRPVCTDHTVAAPDLDGHRCSWCQETYESKMAARETRPKGYDTDITFGVLWPWMTWGSCRLAHLWQHVDESPTQTVCARTPREGWHPAPFDMPRCSRCETQVLMWGAPSVVVDGRCHGMPEPLSPVEAP